MKRLLPILIYLVVSLPVLPVPVSAQQPAISIAAKAYMLSDYQSGQVLASQNVHERVEPASLTKLMTAYIVFSALKQNRIQLDQIVPVSNKAWRMIGSRMFIEPNKEVTVEELIRGMIVQSGNDACIALAEIIAGSEEIFVQMMNQEAQRLGMKNTHFMNTTGLPDPNHYTSVHDLTLLAAAIIRDFPGFYPLYSLKEYTYNNITQPNRNRLLWLDPHVDGMKTGWTKSAGYCLITSAKRDKRRLISVIMGAKSANARSMESQRLLNYGFQFYDTVHLYKKGEVLTSIELWKGAQDVLKAGFNNDVYFSIPKGQADNLKATMAYKQPLIAPITVGQEVGTVKFTLNGQLVESYPLVALENVDMGNFIGRAWDSFMLLFN
ncbi:D-alanyl-D-alanine carboxypeptidase family protein [Nitrosomonas aestuarii]|uniref:serine-type D-Ala-D-Ala carboxypeptidase n=1 Tax=Nitrosomonas aestuarii TaxID=52441 RepID=A0A1I4FQA5_9PROT|nr:D-alanyl-D-alanine carboxypeptidase family protein [Nitrosomonas aestuarii]PTN10349.1 penicillin-binding protein 6 [Nitrosomonas aestuarii]SFL20088.1 penicillin-binding protein 6. Serine peptidase. MEROPS family S11 [Nitrosomonas aestuarii]